MQRYSGVGPGPPVVSARAPQRFSLSLSPRHKRLAVIGIFLVHAVLFSRALAFDAVDDAYISFRYAQNAIHGHGLVFNPGERVEGYTNFLWTVLLAPFIGGGLPAGPLSIIFGLMAGVAVLGLLDPVISEVDTMFEPAIGRWAAVLMAVDGSFALWSVSGLETAFFALLVLAGTITYLRELRDDPRFPWSAIIFAAAAMTRPEGGLWFGLTVVHAGLYRLLAQRRLPNRSDLLRIGTFGVLYGIYFLWRYDYYGHLLPNTFYAKVTLADARAQYSRGLAHVGAFAGYHGAWITVPLAILALARPEARWWTGYLMLILVAYVGYIVYVGGDWSVGRFFVPILAPFYLLVAAGVRAVSDLIHRPSAMLERSIGHVVGTSARVALVLLILWGASFRGEYQHFIQPFDAARATRARTAMGHWLRENVPPGTLIAVDAAGQIPYHAGLPAIDFFGITDPQIAHMTVSNMGEGTPGHEKFGLAQVLARQPEYIIVFGRALDGLPEYRRLHDRWTDDPALYSFLSLYRRID